MRVGATFALNAYEINRRKTTKEQMEQGYIKERLAHEVAKFILNNPSIDINCEYDEVSNAFIYRVDLQVMNNSEFREIKYFGGFRECKQAE